MSAKKYSPPDHGCVEIVDLLKTRFANRLDRFVFRSGNGSWMTAPGQWNLAASAYREFGVSFLISSEQATCRHIAFDFDDHADESLNTLAAAREIYDRLVAFGFQPLLEESSPNSFHLWVKFNEPIPQLQAFRLVENFQTTFRSDDGFTFEIFPKAATGQSYLRCPGFHPVRQEWCKLSPNGGETFRQEMQLFRDWLLLPGDDPESLVPQIIGKVSLFELTEAQYQAKRAQKQHLREVKAAFTDGTSADDWTEAWRLSREKAEDHLQWP